MVGIDVVIFDPLRDIEGVSTGLGGEPVLLNEKRRNEFFAELAGECFAEFMGEIKRPFPCISGPARLEAGIVMMRVFESRLAEFVDDRDSSNSIDGLNLVSRSFIDVIASINCSAADHIFLSTFLDASNILSDIADDSISIDGSCSSSFVDCTGITSRGRYFLL